jgi:hypothetical protein
MSFHHNISNYFLRPKLTNQITGLKNFDVEVKQFQLICNDKYVYSLNITWFLLALSVNQCESSKKIMDLQTRSISSKRQT